MKPDDHLGQGCHPGRENEIMLCGKFMLSVAALTGLLALMQCLGWLPAF
mgnify:CR=1 FL=1